MKHKTSIVLQKNARVDIFCDGCCRGNPGPGGFGMVIRSGGQTWEGYGAENNTTNNRQELLGAVIALEALTEPAHVTVTSDSQYVVKGMQEWLPGWVRNHWRTASKEPVKNVDLWQRLKQAADRHVSVNWVWVKGHAGHPENERVDQLANLGVDRLLPNHANTVVINALGHSQAIAETDERPLTLSMGEKAFVVLKTLWQKKHPEAEPQAFETWLEQRFLDIEKDNYAQNGPILS